MLEWNFEAKMDCVDGLFSNGLRKDNISCHRESYMTVMDYDKMTKFLEGERTNYTIKQWEELIKYFQGKAYLSPMNGLVACEIQRTILKEKL